MKLTLLGRAIASAQTVSPASGFELRKENTMNRLVVNARFSFLYVVISAVAVGCVMTYSLVAGFSMRHTVLLLVGAVLGAWAILFSFLEIRRLARSSGYRADEALQDEPDPYAPRTVVVQPPTGVPYPHHEDYPESAGLEEGQLVFRIPEPTPIIEDFLNRRHKARQKVVHEPSRNRREPASL